MRHMSGILMYSGFCFHRAAPLFMLFKEVIKLFNSASSRRHPDFQKVPHRDEDFCGFRNSLR